jgi:hypothetical protein
MVVVVVDVTIRDMIMALTLNQEKTEIKVRAIRPLRLINRWVEQWVEQCKEQIQNQQRKNNQVVVSVMAA